MRKGKIKYMYIYIIEYIDTYFKYINSKKKKIP